MLTGINSKAIRGAVFVALLVLRASGGEREPSRRPAPVDLPDPEQVQDNAGPAVQGSQLVDNQPLDPVVRQHLTRWIAATEKIHRFDCEFQSYKYDHTWGMEYRGAGSLAVDRDGRGEYRHAPAPIRKNHVSKKKNEDGQPYDLKPARAERWHWTGNEIFKIDEVTRRFEVAIIDKRPATPLQRAWQRSWFLLPHQFWLAEPYLLGMPVAELQRRYRIELHRETPVDVVLCFKPRSSEDAELFSEVSLRLSRETWLPVALKLKDPSGMTETVYVFRGVRVNLPDAEAGDLAHPNLDGYRRDSE